jgi:hypothetical protein
MVGYGRAWPSPLGLLKGERGILVKEIEAEGLISVAFGGNGDASNPGGVIIRARVADGPAGTVGRAVAVRLEAKDVAFLLSSMTSSSYMASKENFRAAMRAALDSTAPDLTVDPAIKAALLGE